MFAEVLTRLGQAALARGHLIAAQVHADALGRQPAAEAPRAAHPPVAGSGGADGRRAVGWIARWKRHGDLANRTLLAFEAGRAWDVKGRLDRAGECWAVRGMEPAAGPRQHSRRPSDPARPAGAFARNLQVALDRYDAAVTCAVNRPQRQEAALRRLLVLLDLKEWGQVCAGCEQALDGQAPEQLPKEIQPVAKMVQALVQQAPDPP